MKLLLPFLCNHVLSSTAHLQLHIFYSLLFFLGPCMVAAWLRRSTCESPCSKHMFHFAAGHAGELPAGARGSQGLRVAPRCLEPSVQGSGVVTGEFTFPWREDVVRTLPVLSYSFRTVRVTGSHRPSGCPGWLAPPSLGGTLAGK